MTVDSSELAKGRRSRREAGDNPPLVEAKLQPPGAGGDHVKRPRILQALDAGEGVPLTLVAAPAGYGKTTAVRAWCESRESALAWVTLDDGDNDPVRLWTYVATAVDRVRQGLGRGALQTPERGGELPRTCRRRADERDRRVRHRDGSRARRPSGGDGSGVSCLDRLRAQTSAAERTHARHHAGRSRARVGAAACSGRTRGTACRRAGLHHRGGARAARRARAGRAPGGGARPACREHRGLARCARSRRALASGRR